MAQSQILLKLWLWLSFYHQKL